MTDILNYELHVFKLPKLKSIVDESVRFFENTPVLILPPSRFPGCGVYALYYRGDLELYAPLTRLNKDTYARPIYVGKAVPPGRRTGRTTDSEMTKLHSRLREHMRSIQQGADLQMRISIAGL
jgi:hypothetical protein